MPESVPRFVSWAAVSTKEQVDKVSIPDQLRYNREHAERRGGVIVDELVVPGESRSIVLFEHACQRIEAYARLRDLIAARAFDVLIFRDRSRLGRKISLITTITELCSEAGIALYDVESPPDSLEVASSYDDLLIGAIKAVGSQREVAEIRRRHLHGMIGRTQKGLMPRGAPFGYRYLFDDRGKYSGTVQEEPHASTVRRVFDLYFDGVSQDNIAKMLNREGRPSARPPALWTKSGIRSVFLKVWVYAGFAELNRKATHWKSPKPRPYVRSQGDWAPIISVAEAEQYIAERTVREKDRYVAGTEVLLKRLCYCAECGGVMTVSSGGRVKERRFGYHYLRCTRHEHAVTCRYETVFGMLRERFAEWQEEAGIAPTPDDSADILSGYQLQIDAHVSSLDRDHDAIARLDDAFADGLLDADRFRAQVARVQQRMEETDNAIASLQKQMQEIREFGTMHRRAREVAELGLKMLDDPDVTRTNAWLRRHVKITVGRKFVDRILRI